MQCMAVISHHHAMIAPSTQADIDLRPCCGLASVSLGLAWQTTPAPCALPPCRPDYKRLDIFKLKFPRVPLMALTATATPRVQHDVRQQLRIPKCITFKSSFNRPNLRWGWQGCRVGNAEEVAA
jgi:hypothetical protein